jgi:hypothetical protein
MVKTKETSEKKKSSKSLLYPEVGIQLLDKDNGQLTVDTAKELLGWVEETEEDKFGKNFLLRDNEGTKIRCTNNLNNRPLSKANYLLLKQEILRKNWKLNGEPIIIGKKGKILSGQHQLIALVLAGQDVEASDDNWGWKGPVQIPKLIVTGISELDSVVNTLDTARPRTLKDVVYRSKYYSKLAHNEKLVYSKLTDFSIRILWDQTNGQQAYGLKRTHTECLHFLERHMKLLDAVAHIAGEIEGEKNPYHIVRSTYAAGLLYLMGCSNTDPTEYQATEDPDESLLNWDNWDRACDFWTLLLQRSNELRPVEYAFGKQSDEESEGAPSLAQRISTVTKGWSQFIQKKKITKDSVKLLSETNEDGIVTLTENPTMGGIDLGSVRYLREAD